MMDIIINHPELAKLHDRQPGGAISVADKNGVPVDRYWRERLKDAAIDGCVEVVEAVNNTPAPPPKPETNKGAKK